MDNKAKLITEYAEKIGIDKIGFASAPWEWQGEKYKEYLDLGYSCGFEEQDLAKRYNPEYILPNAQTLISIAMAYPAYQAPVNEFEARFCAASVGMDYHTVLTEKLELLGAFLLELVPGSHYKTAVDTGLWSDREIAVMCGLGWIGKNSNLVTEEYGSFVYLGEIIWDVLLETDEITMHDYCGNCTACVRACPAQAIDSERRMVDTRRCLAYKTLDKEYPDEQTISNIAANGYIYGCDVCQLACPYNKRAKEVSREYWQDKDNLAACDIRELLSMSNKEFKRKYEHISGSWRGKNVLLRNGIWILGARRSEEMRTVWQSLIAGDNESLRRAASWALARYEEE